MNWTISIRTIVEPCFKLGFGKIVEILVRNGAEISRKNTDGKTIMDIAIENGKLKLNENV